ncbi:Protein FAR1-RELATED SEQUENCE 6 [Bienertia sinuspersici]
MKSLPKPAKKDKMEKMKSLPKQKTKIPRKETGKRPSVAKTEMRHKMCSSLYAKQQGFGIVKAGGAYKQEKGKTLNERRNCTWKCESGGKPDARIRQVVGRLFQHHDEGVSIPQIHSALAAERNGVENFPVSERQLRNVVDKERRLKMMEGDANAMAAYFHRMTMERRAKDEKQADADSARFCHQLVSDFPIERVFQKIYTSAKFLEVQQECLKNIYVSIVGCQVVDEKVLEYTIEDRVWVRDPNTRKDIPTRRKREYEVKYNSNTSEAWCVCKLMESFGIICRHIIAVF